jgi:hypothetical protein
MDGVFRELTEENQLLSVDEYILLYVQYCASIDRDGIVMRIDSTLKRYLIGGHIVLQYYCFE